ncbi:Rad52/Rad22 family DNA repair protein [Tepidamorphus sp. 3E244]|uniref:Rad52/Rad22 family DNA repair protein n=1 Tax=Tepidamorphus sp. 3E244 TaxID=3385498 RepID=UPI0038FC97E9
MFTDKQLRQLNRRPPKAAIRTRKVRGKDLAYLEGHYAISLANKIFGSGSWSRETIEANCIRSSNGTQEPFAVYSVRVRVIVSSGIVVRDGYGIGEGRGGTLAEAHEIALKGAETDATKRALATFGRAFGLDLRADDASHRSIVDKPGDNPRNTSATRLTTKVATTHTVNSQSQQPRQPTKLQRIRSKSHLHYVRAQPCLVCGASPSDPHHLNFAQPRAMGMKAGDNFTVPLCRTHHSELHNSGGERQWWETRNLDPLVEAKRLWHESQRADRMV